MFTKIGAFIGSFIAMINLGVSKPQETEPTWSQSGYVEVETIETENIEIENIIVEDIQRERYEGEILIIENAPVAIADKVTFNNNVMTWDSPNITKWD